MDDGDGGVDDVGVATGGVGILLLRRLLADARGERIKEGEEREGELWEIMSDVAFGVLGNSAADTDDGDGDGIGDGDDDCDDTDCNAGADA